MGGIIFLVILSLALLVAIIVFTVIWYKRYIGSQATVQDKNSKAGAFLNFDHLIIEKLMKFLYLFQLVIAIAGAVFLPFLFAILMGYGASLANLSYGIYYSYFSVGGMFAGFFLGLIISAMAFVISQLCARLSYELIMLFVIITNNTTTIRKTLVETPMAASPADQGAQVPVPPVMDGWTCPTCGATGLKGKFCTKCGTRQL